MVSVKVPFAVRVPETDVFGSAMKLQLAKNFPALAQSRKSCNDGPLSDQCARGIYFTTCNSFSVYGFLKAFPKSSCTSWNAPKRV